MEKKLNELTIFLKSKGFVRVEFSDGVVSGEFGEKPDLQEFPRIFEAANSIYPVSYILGTYANCGKIVFCGHDQVVTKLYTQLNGDRLINVWCGRAGIKLADVQNIIESEIKLIKACAEIHIRAIPISERKVLLEKLSNEVE